MSIPNVEAARKRFVERVALAYFTTWHGYGFVGPEYEYDNAVAAAEELARNFPKPVEAKSSFPTPDYDDGVVDRD